MVRPRFITILSWLFIVSGVVGLFAGLLVVRNEQALQLLRETTIPIGVSAGLTFGSSLVYLVSGVGLLKPFNWSRHLLAALVLVTLLVGLTYSPQKFAVIPGAILMVLMVWPLYRPMSDRYFKHQMTDADVAAMTEPKPPSRIGTLRKLIAILLYLVSGFIVYVFCFGSFVGSGEVNILPELVRIYALPWLISHSLAIFLFKTPARWLSSGITFLVGPLFTMLILCISLYYPLPDTYADLDLKSQFSNFTLGIPILVMLIAIGGLQLSVGIVQMRASSVKSDPPKNGFG